MEDKNKRLQLRFADLNDKLFSISFAEFKEDISLQEATDACNEAIQSGAFAYKGNEVKEFKEALVIEISKRKLA